MMEWVAVTWLDTLSLRQKGRHFADISKCIFMNKNWFILIQISLRCVPKGPVNNKPALVQIEVWRQTGAMPLSEQMMA